MGTPLTLERCAEMRAEMEAGRLRDDVLARAGIDADAWTIAQREWLERMGSELKRSRFELTNRYSQAFMDRQRELAALARPAAEALPVAAAPVAPPMGLVAPPMQPLPPPMAPPAPPSIVGTPSAQRAGDASPSPWAGEEHRPLATLPPPTLPPQTAPSPWSDATGAPEPSPLRAVLPFHEAPAGALPPPALPPRAPAAPRPPPANPGGPLDANATVLGAVSPFAAGAVLPFTRDSAPSPPVQGGAPVGASVPLPAAPPPRPAAPPPKLAPPPPRPMAPPSRPGAPPPPAAALPLPPRSPTRTSSMPQVAEPHPMGTVFDAVSPFAAGPALPFAPAHPPPAAPPAPPPPPLPPPAPPPARAPGPPQAPASAVAPPPPARAPGPPQAPASAVAPAPHPPAATLPNLTLEQHASLCAELAYAPARGAEVLGRYHVTAPMKAELDQLWQARFKADPGVEKKWQDAYRIYFSFLSSAQRR